MVESYLLKKTDWRTRAIFKANGLFVEEIYPFINAGIRILPYNYLKNGLNIIECYVRKQDFPDIVDAFHYSKTKVFEFTDQISIVTNDKVDILSFLSTCPMEVTKGEKFEMLLPQESYIDKNIFKIKSSDLDYYEKVFSNSNYLEAIRQAREGLCSISKDSKILFYFSALERIAEFEATERITFECPKCGNIDDRGVATSRFIQSELEKYGISKSKYKQIRKLRSKIAHGSGVREIGFINKVNELLPSLESATLSLLSEKCEIEIKSVNKIHTSDDFLIVYGKKIFSKWYFIPSWFVIVDSKQEVKLSISRTRGSGIEDVDENGLYGQEYQPNMRRPIIDKECWPY